MSDRGSAGLSVVMLTPVVLALLAFAVLAGRIGAADQDVVSAAQAAARAASLRQGVGDATADARQAAEVTLREAGIECLSTSVATSVGPASVTATVACAIKLSDLVDLAVPGQTTIRVSASAPVDTYRGGS
jgi:Flp pilus assembly protein TadG